MSEHETIRSYHDGDGESSVSAPRSLCRGDPLSTVPVFRPQIENNCSYLDFTPLNTIE
jgi:hypothetical protein